MGPLSLLPAALSVGKAVIGLFKKRGEHEKAKSIEDALTVLGGLTDEAENDPELKRLLVQKDIEFEKSYTERVKASLEVIKTEAQSEDSYVRRARPSWLYAALLIFIVDFCVFPVLKIRLFDYVPVEIYRLFIIATTSGYLGYGVFRTVDKKGGSFKDIFKR